jgi:hypothetical protein
MRDYLQTSSQKEEMPQFLWVFLPSWSARSRYESRKQLDDATNNMPEKGERTMRKRTDLWNNLATLSAMHSDALHIIKPGKFPSDGPKR